MTDKFVAIKYQVTTPNSIFPETIEKRWDDPRMTPEALMEVAGSEFHKGFVKSVCVFDETGFVYLWLNKDRSGKCIKRERNDK